MNDLLKDRLRAVDEILLEAIRAVFTERIEKEKPQIGESTNELLGEKYRAYETAQKLVNEAFKDLSAYQIEKRENKTFNKGR